MTTPTIVDMVVMTVTHGQNFNNSNSSKVTCIWKMINVWGRLDKRIYILLCLRARLLRWRRLQGIWRMMHWAGTQRECYPTNHRVQCQGYPPIQYVPWIIKRVVFTMLLRMHITVTKILHCPFAVRSQLCVQFFFNRSRL